MKTGSVFIPTAKDYTSVLILRLHGYLRLIVLTFEWHEHCRLLNIGVCFGFFPLTKSRASLCFFNRLPVKSRRCRSYSFWRSSFNADMDRCLWFSRRGRSGTRRRQVRRTRRCHFPWCRWTRSRALATWPRSRHRTLISFRIRATCRLTDWQGTQIVVRGNPHPLFSNLSFQTHFTQICASVDWSGQVSAVWKEPEKLQAVSFSGDYCCKRQGQGIIQ